MNGHTIREALMRRFEASPDEPFVRCGARWLTFAELDATSDRLAAGLAPLGVGKGGRVALIVPNRQEMVELFFACAKLGAVQVPLNCFLRGEFLRYQLADSGAAVLVADAAGVTAARDLLTDTEIHHVVTLDTPDDGAGPAATTAYKALLDAAGPVPSADVASRDLFAILYTSGTTGMPKGCMIPNGYYFGNAEANADAGWVQPGDRVFTAFPLFHMGGHHAVVSALVNGAAVCVEPQFSASTFLARAAEESATVLLGVGPMGMALLAQPPAASDGDHPFRMAMFTPMHPDRQAEFEARFKTPVIAEGYGQTECSPATISALHGERKRGTAGRPVAHIELRIVDNDDREVARGEVGEIVVRPRRPDVAFQGYWRKPEVTAEAWRNLWHHTGDYGRLDDDGFLTFVDRKSDALRRRGENISSFQLEAAIAAHPAVAQAAVTAVPSPLGEDDVKATIVCGAGTEPTADELFAFFAEHLPYFAIPRYVEIREALPVNALGRVMKYVLRDEGITPTTSDLEALGLTVGKAARRG